MKKVILFSALMIFLSSSLLTSQVIVERKSYYNSAIKDSTYINSFKTFSIDASNNLFIGMEMSNYHIWNNVSGVRYSCLLMIDSDLNKKWNYVDSIKSKPLFLRNFQRFDDSTISAVRVQSNSWSIDGYYKLSWNIMLFNENGNLRQQNSDTVSLISVYDTPNFALDATSPFFTRNIWMDTNANIVYNWTTLNPIKTVLEEVLLEYDKKNIYETAQFDFIDDNDPVTNDPFVLLAYKYDLNYQNSKSILLSFNANGKLIEEKELDTVEFPIMKFLIKSNTGIAASYNRGLYIFDLTNYEISRKILKLNEKDIFISDIKLEKDSLIVSGTVLQGDKYKPVILKLDNNFNIIYSLVIDEDLTNGIRTVLTTLNSKNEILVSFTRKDNDSLYVYKIRDKAVSVNDGCVSNELVISPNPASDNITISLDPLESSEISIFNMLGEIVISVEVRHAEPVRINISDLPKGMYFVKTGNRAAKFVKI